MTHDATDITQVSSNNDAYLRHLHQGLQGLLRVNPTTYGVVSVKDFLLSTVVLCLAWRELALFLFLRALRHWLS